MHEFFWKLKLQESIFQLGEIRGLLGKQTQQFKNLEQNKTVPCE